MVNAGTSLSQGRWTQEDDEFILEFQLEMSDADGTDDGEEFEVIVAVDYGADFMVTGMRC